MPSQLYSVVVDAHDPAALAGFWASALGYSVAYTLPDEVAIEAPDDTGPAIVFASVPRAKATKNRLHFELNPDDQVAEVARLTELGAQHVDIGQRDVPWVVLADPEGNEFCVLTRRES
ncbi:MAG: VOC family protein [Geodermatophilaceae bacterium]|nr:VOC family protein [Geodermatophilaceae bacterium]